MWSFEKKLWIFVCLMGVLVVGGYGPKNQDEAAAAVNFPDKEITIVAAAAPGGALDLHARAVAKGLSKLLNKPVVVKNNAGASGMAGITETVRKKPDGYNLIASADTNFTSQPILQKDLGYKQDDFDFLVSMATSIPAIVVTADTPYKTLAEFVQDTKAKNTIINFGHPGTGTTPHLSGELLFELAGVKSQNIPFKGGGPSVTALLGKKIDVLLVLDGTILPQVKAGTVRALAVSSLKRSTFLPDVPTMKEAGYDVDVNSRHLIYGPKGIPNEVKKVLDDAFKKMAADPEFQKTMVDLGLNVDVIRGKDIVDYINRKIPVYKKLLTAIN